MSENKNTGVQTPDWLNEDHNSDYRYFHLKCSCGQEHILAFHYLEIPSVGERFIISEHDNQVLIFKGGASITFNGLMPDEKKIITKPLIIKS